MLSHAQNFEDVMLARLFADQSEGFYIDVGASHPSVGSVTRHFYDRGWSGINIEPLAGAFTMLQQERPRDLNLCAAAAAREGVASFTEAVDFTGLSTLDRAQAAYLRQRGLTLREYRVAAVTLDGVFERHVRRTVDFLKIDAEGGEAAVLAGFDLRRHRPRALVIEAIPAGRPFQGWDAAMERDRSWEPPLLAAGYRFAHFDGLNAFYLREEDAALAARLRLPPGLYDAIRLPPPPDTPAAYPGSPAADPGSPAADRRVAELTQRLEALRGKLHQRNAEVARLIAERESLAAHIGGFARRRLRQGLRTLGLGRRRRNGA